MVRSSLRGAGRTAKDGPHPALFRPPRSFFSIQRTHPKRTRGEDCSPLDKRKDELMARKGTETGGPAETKAAKFSRLASARVTRAVKAINRVGALASAQYEKTQRK